MQLITRECFRRPRNSYPTYITSWSICRITSSRARTTNNMSILILRNKWSCGELNESQNNISKILKKLLFKFLLFKWTRTEPSTGPHCLSAYLNDKVTWDLTSWYLFLLFSRLVHRSTASLLRPRLRYEREQNDGQDTATWNQSTRWPFVQKRVEHCGIVRSRKSVDLRRS